MVLRVEHPLHDRRRGRNVGLGLVLLAFVALIFGLSVVKIRQGDLMEGFDHQQRASSLPLAPVAPAPGPAPAASGTAGAAPSIEKPVQ